MKTFEPSGRMKSGLLMSSPSAKNATFTPLPVASCCAEGVLGSSNAVLVVCSASGSSSGLLGLLGQTPGTGVPLGAVAEVRALGPEAAGRARRITASGTTFATALFALSFLASAADTLAENAFSTVYW